MPRTPEQLIFSGLFDKPSWWPDWLGFSPPSGRDPSDFQSSGVDEGAYRKAGQYGYRPLYEPPAYLRSFATPALRATGIRSDTANKLIRFARRGRLQFTPEGKLIGTPGTFLESPRPEQPFYWNDLLGPEAVTGLAQVAYTRALRRQQRAARRGQR